MILTAKWIIILFGIFFIMAGILMFFAPSKSGQMIRKAGSTNFINYFEITIRMIPAAGLIFYAEFSKFPKVFEILGWFMLCTSLVLYFVPRRVHHNFAVKAAEVLKPFYLQLFSPLSIFIGCALIYSVN